MNKELIYTNKEIDVLKQMKIVTNANTEEFLRRIATKSPSKITEAQEIAYLEIREEIANHSNVKSKQKFMRIMDEVADPEFIKQDRYKEGMSDRAIFRASVGNNE